MKKKILKGLASLALLVGTVACNDGAGLGFGQGDGKIALTAEINASVASARSSRAEYTDVTPADLSIRLTSADGSFSQTWDGVAAFPTDRRFKAGDYTIEAFYGDDSTEGFESPAFYGSQIIRVEDGLTTPVHLTAGVSNSLVTIAYTDNFKDYMTSYTAGLHSAGGSYIEYAADESRPAYVKTGTVEISVDFVKPNGVGGKLKVASFEAVAARHYNVTVDLGGDGAGAASIVVTLDESLNEEPLTIDISDEVLNAPAPQVTADGFTDGTAVEFVPGQTFDNTFKFNIVATGGIGEVTLTTQSASLLAKDWPAEVELVGASETVRSTMTSLGLSARGLFKNPDKLGVIDLTAVLANIAYLNSGNNTSTFTVLVTDRSGKQSEPVTLTVEAQPVKMNITNTELYVGSSTLSFDLEFNAGDPASLVRFEYANTRGTRTVFTPVIEKTGDHLYRVTTELVAGDVDPVAAVQLYATCEGVGTVNVTVERAPAVVTDSRASVNAFAKGAYIPVTIGDKDSDTDLFNQLLSKATVMLSTDGTNFREVSTTAFSDAKMLYITGLEPASTYIVKVKNGSLDYASAPSSQFTTEAATQIPNSNMEEWSVTNIGTNRDRYAVSGWNTLNPLTTSQNGSPLGSACVAPSGTISTTDTPSGNGLAALIRTVGWGNGTTAAADFLSKVKHVDRGELSLGTWDGVTIADTELPVYGIDFTTRPASLTFKYKYDAQKGHDDGYVEIKVLDAVGNVIAQNQSAITSQSSWSEKTLALTYGPTSAKAARVSVIFRSCNHGKSLDGTSMGKDDVNLAKFTNTKGVHTGSQLYIDDIVLNY